MCMQINIKELKMSNKAPKDTGGLQSNVRKSPYKLFVLTVLISAIIYFTIYLFLGNGRFADFFFIRSADFFMDFFNSIRDAAQGSEVYTERGVIYPPMANLIYLILSRFTPESYNNSSFEDRYSWPQYFTPLALVVLVTTALAIIYFFLVYSNVESSSRLKRFAFAFLAFFNVPVLYMIERGNMIVFCLIALLVYAFTYNSDNKRYRELGLIALAFAFSIKLYPVVFGWFLLADKRFKDALRCLIYGVLMLLIPSFFFGGPSCFVYVFLNIFSFSSGSGSTLSVVLNFIHTPDTVQTIITLLAYLWVLICGLCFAVSPFVRADKPWKTYALGFVTILCVPSLTSIYSWAFLIIPLMLLCRQKQFSRSDWVYAIFMTIPFAFLPFRFSFHVAPNTVIVYLMTAVLSVFAVIDTVKDTSKFISTNRSNGIKFKDYMRSLIK